MSKLQVGINDLETYCKQNNLLDLLEEWDYENNNNIFPNTIASGSRTKVYWKCPQGHEYQASINARTSNKTGCPYCSGQKILKGFNDFETWCKNNNQIPLLNEWDSEKNEIMPSEVAPRSDKSIYWKCSFCGNEWSARIKSRTRHKDVFGCKKCATAYSKQRDSRNKALKELSLADLYPEIAKEWDIEKNKCKPDEVLSKSNKKAWWKCKNGHSYQSVINRRTGQGSGCPICANRAVLRGFNDLLTINPELASEWDYNKNTIEPSDVVPMSHKKVWWKCKECGNEWEAVISSRSKGNGCPRCAKELQTSFPEQALFYYLKQIYPDAINGDNHLGKELDIYVPSQKFAVEYDGVKWHQDTDKDIFKNTLCKDNGITLYRIREKGCPDLVDNNSEIIYVENESESEVYSAIKQLFKILCINIEVDLSKDRANIYAQYLRNKKEKSIIITHPELLKKFDYENNIIRPEHIYHGSNKKIWWICNKGHHYQSTVTNTAKGIGCPICNGNQVLKGFNDFETWCKSNNFDYLLAEWDKTKNTILPSSVTKSTKTLIWWNCKEGHSYQTYTYLRIRGVGCPFCSGKKVLKGYNDLATVKPELVKEWDYENNTTEPSDYTMGSNKKVFWKCPQGHSYEASISHRTRGRGCPVCAGKKILYGINDFATLFPQLLAELDYEKKEIQPDKILPGSNKRVWWKCKNCGNEWQTSVCNRTCQNTGCPSCSRKEVWAKRKNIK